MKILFFVESQVLGSQVMGHARIVEAVQLAVDDSAGDELKTVGFGPTGRLASRFIGDVRGLARLDADFQQTRWHVVNSLRARRLIQAALASYPADVVGCVSHSVSLALGDVVDPRPLVLSVDVAMWEWRQMGIWRRVRPWSRGFISASLLLERRALERAALVVAMTQWSKQGVVRRAPTARVVVLHPGVDLELYHPAAVRSPRQRPRVLFVGGRFREKGGQDLLRAVEPLLGHDLELDVVTPEPITEHVGLRHLRDPSREELAERYRQADLLVLPTYGDAVPLTVVEAMASGTPVIATPVGAIPELLNGGGGVLVPVGSPDALRQAITRLLGDDAGRTEMGQAGRATCEERYDARRQNALFLEHMHRLVASPSLGAPAGRS